MLFCLRTLFLIFTLCFSSFIYSESEPREPIQAELLYETDSIQPGQPFWVAVRLDIDDHWHTYWKNPGDAGMATSIKWTLPEGFKADSLEWPFPQRFGINSTIGYGYEGEVLLLAKITPAESIKDSTEFKIGADVRWVVCSDSTCVPGEVTLDLTLPVKNTPSAPNSEKVRRFADARNKMPKEHQAFTAQRKNDLIELVITLPNDSAQKVNKAYFCPETKNMIRHEIDALLTKTDGLRNTYTIILKDGKNNDKKSALKGVLVLQSEGHSEAFSVDVPVINAEGENELSLADTHVDHKPEAMLNIAPEHEFQGGFFVALVLAFIGGLILNLMPCVLPVVSFKILSFVKMAGQSRSLTLKHGLLFSAGVIVSFWALAGALLALQAYGKTVGWGFQLQEPLFVAGLASVIFLFGLSLFGVFEIGTSVTAWADTAQQSAKFKPESLTSSFFSGILATAVATPCTGPFLGSAIGFAVTLSAPLAMLIFTSLGLGMAAPYLLLSAFPSLLRFMPRPGNWMNTFKEIMGFMMIATVLWLVWVFGAQTNTLAVFLLLSGFFFLTMGAWIYGKWGTPVKSLNSRITSYAFSLACLVIGASTIYYSVSPMIMAMSPSTKSALIADSEDKWEEYSPQRVAELRLQGIPVFVDFTAKWCLICQTNHVILSMEQIYSKMRDLGVVRMKADWTKNDPVITDALRKFGRNGVPLYLLYGPDASKPPKILPQFLTPEVVLENLREIEPHVKAGRG